MVSMILLQVILIALNAVFACAEIAVISVNERKMEKLAEEGDKKAGRLLKLTKQPARFLSTIQVAITLSGFLGSAFAAENFSGSLTDWMLSMGVPISRGALETISVVLITIILSYFTLIFGELVPKRLAMRKAESLARAVSGLITFISKVFAPIVWLLTVSTNGVLRLLQIDPDADDEEVSEEEIRLMVDEGSEKGAIDREEKEFIQNVFEFDDLTAGEIATHRTDLSILWMEDSMEEWDRIIREEAHTRYPICDGTADHVVGILNSKTYFRLNKQDRETVMREAVRKPYFIPEGVKADILFKNMRQQHKSLAVALDEYGGLVGIVTIHDLVEKLVGTLTDEEQVPEEPYIENMGANQWRIRGCTPCSTVEKALDVTLPEGDFDTLGGLLFHLLGKIPPDGSREEVSLDSLQMIIEKVQDHQIETVTVTKKEDLQKTEEPEEE